VPETVALPLNPADEYDGFADTYFVLCRRRAVPEQTYIVTDRGGSRSYPILVTVDGPEDGNLYLRAQEKAAQLSRDIADCGKEVSAFRLSAPKVAKWLEMQARLAAAEGPPISLEDYRSIQAEITSFLSKL
jgi:hypothetical protein